MVWNIQILIFPVRGKTSDHKEQVLHLQNKKYKTLQKDNQGPFHPFTIFLASSAFILVCNGNQLPKKQLECILEN